MRPIAFLFTVLLGTHAGFSQAIDLTKTDGTVQSGHLKVGGKNPQGLDINAGSRFLTLDGNRLIDDDFYFGRQGRNDLRIQ